MGTVSKLKALTESADAGDRHYLEAVGSVLARELTRIIVGAHCASDRRATDLQRGRSDWSSSISKSIPDRELSVHV